MTDLLLMKIYRKRDVILVNLDPTKGSEIAKIRPCLVVSPNPVNMALNTLIIVPFTTANFKLSKSISIASNYFCASTTRQIGNDSLP